MRSANNVGNAGPHVPQAFLNDVITFLSEVGNAGGHFTFARLSSVVMLQERPHFYDRHIAMLPEL
jgi:predicted PurR-regulated permease PerM